MHNPSPVVNFLGVGAQKAGTSWIYACLYEHPEICAPVKEIHFFSRPRFAKGRDWYERHFRTCPADAKKGEFSTSYLYSEKAAERIATLYPHAQIIAVLRDPEDRAYSQYRNAIKAGEIDAQISFSEYAVQTPSVYEQGLYADQLARYYAHFDSTQILVLIYEDIEKDPATFMRTIYKFLGVDTSFVPSMCTQRINVARTPRLVALDRVMHTVAEKLRIIGLDKFVWLVRKSGAPDLLRRINTAPEQPTQTQVPDIPAQTREAMRADAVRVSELIGRDVAEEWFHQ